VGSLTNPAGITVVDHPAFKNRLNYRVKRVLYNAIPEWKRDYLPAFRLGDNKGPVFAHLVAAI
jgi:hypothetical protein